MKLKDDSPMPFGKYKGTAMINVPADYLLFLYDTGKCNTEVKLYIAENLEILKKEVIEQSYTPKTKKTKFI